MIDRNCPICFGVGWVCENHPNMAWHNEVGCKCGAGMPCKCNRDGDDGDLLEGIDAVFEDVTVH